MRSARDGARRSKRRRLREQLAGLSRWQVALVLIPLVIVPFGGAIGGCIAGLAAAANLTLARKQISTATKAVSMTCICAAAFAAFLGVSIGIARLLHSSQPSTAQHAPAGTVTTLPPANAGWEHAQPRPTGVAVYPPTVIHDDGAELSWPAYVNTTGKAANDLAGYEVHRSTNDFYAPSAANLLASVGARTTTFADSSAPMVKTLYGGIVGVPYYYMVAVRTRSGALVAGPIRLVWLPAAGDTDFIVAATAATTLSKAHPKAVVRSFTLGGFLRPWLEVGRDTHGYGVTRAVFEFGSLDAIPAGAQVVTVRLSVWAETSTDTYSYGRYQLHALSRSFSGTQATWRQAAVGTAWTRPGGDFRAPASLGLPGVGEEPLRDYFDATAIVRRWLRSPGADHGLLLKLADEAKPTPGAEEQAFFAGMSADDPGQRPALMITVSDS